MATIEEMLSAKLEASKPINLPINPKLQKNKKANHRITIINNENQTIKIFTIISLYEIDGSIIQDENVVSNEKIIEIGNDTLVDLDGNILGKVSDFDKTPDNSIGYFDYISSLINPIISSNIINGLI